MGNTTGSFVGLTAGQITNLDSATEPIGVGVSPVLLMTFANDPDIELFVTEVFAGTGGTASCGAVAAVGQTCTPPGSGVTFTNTSTGASASFSLIGTAKRLSTGEVSAMQGLLTAQFVGASFQQVLAAFVANGQSTTSYSGSFVITAVPEPATLSLIGFGLLGLGFVGRKFRR